MSTVFDAQGTTWSGLSITQDLKTVQLPEAWEKAVKDISSLANSDVKTKKLGSLKDHEPVVLTVEYDPDLDDSYSDSNGQCVITLPDSAGTLTFWGQISGVGAPDGFEVDGDPVQEVTITVTNLNGSDVETAPVFAS